ncbi:AfsR/SARP family transcriptional regulator [Amycolatopsis sp. H20-H5]|uniref:AfsR/SARP family transcriptional regulator n=1 Tax=Amycolatopsis sp. H20-H5 TaxID=3046309 RepID=UPI002DBEF4F5|nr:AfsR/SARP family transcriptional regulator [Amycolatopsis sp. H20-H5]MEC3982032.1 AfsR/SARP family transcriptional regulator [Amycolatopsis sp. H20-H5]
MHIQLLGRLRIRRFDDEVTLSAAKQRSVLATLAVHADTHVPLGVLVDELWESRPPATAVRTVQTYVYQIRRSLQLAASRAETDHSYAALLTSSRGYVLRLGEHSVVDTTLFRDLVKRGRARLSADENDEAVRDLRSALELWSGPVFGDVPKGSALGAAAISLEQVRTRAREMLYDAELRCGRHDDIVDELVGLTHADPTQERFSALLMTALLRGDHRAEALRVFHNLRAALDAQFGVPPSPTVQRVLSQILTDSSKNAGAMLTH